MKTIKLLLLCVVVTLFLAACGDNEEAQSEDGVIELTLWNDWTEGRPENTVYKNIIQKFNEEHDDIQIVSESIPHDDYEIKLRTQAAGNQLPDMMRVWPGTRVEPLVEGNALLPLNPIIDHWEGMIPEEILQDYAVDENYYAIPSNISETSLIFYNKEIVSEAGYDEFPTTYVEFKGLVEALKTNYITPFSFGNKEIWPLHSVFISGIADRYTGSDFLGNVLNGDGTFEDEQFIHALSVIEELTKLEAFNEDMNTIDEAQSRNEFIKGSTAMHFAGSWAIGPIMDSVDNVENIGVAAFPSFEGGEGDPSKISGVAGGGIASALQELFEQDMELIKKKLNHERIEKADWLIKQAEDYIKEYFRTTIKVQEVADVINVSANYFSSLFKQKTGENFNEYVNKLRVEEAKSLLINTPFRVSEISKQVGFQEYKYFVRVFKKFSGLTPTNYRKLTAIE